MSLVQQLRVLKTRRHQNTTQRADEEVTRKARFAAAWNDLSTRIDRWLKDLVTEDLLSLIKTANEAGEVAFHIDIIDPDTDPIRLSLYPHNCFCIGCDGRVNIRFKNSPAYSLLLFSDSHWELLEDASRKIVNKAFSALDMEQLLEQILISEVIK